MPRAPVDLGVDDEFACSAVYGQAHRGARGPLDGDAAHPAANPDRNDARGLRQDQVELAGSALQLEGGEPYRAQIRAPLRDAASQLDGPRDRAVQGNLSRVLAPMGRGLD